MNKARDLRNIVLGAIITASGLSALAAINLTTFTPNTPIKSAEVNANFSSLQASVEALEAPVGVSRLATTGTAADGKVLKLQAGSLAWADDLTGTGGGTAYSAGTGLALSGTTFSVANAGITRAMLSTSGSIADGKVLKLSSGNLIWSDDLTGAGGGTAYSAGTGLALTGTTFSVALPLNLNSSSGPPLLAVNNSTGNGISGISSGGSIGLLGRSSARGIVGTQGDLGMSCAGTYAVGGCATDGNGVQGVSQTGTAAYFKGGSGGTGVCAFNGGAGWTCTSDRNKKENFSPVDARSVLEAVAKLPITRWNMKGDAKKTPHIGPVAQDFYAAFGLGEDNKTINSADLQGVTLAAIKGLSQENQSLNAQNAELTRKMGDLESQMASLQTMQSKLVAIETRLGRTK